MSDLAGSALELYRMTGQTLTEADEQALSEMLALDAEGRWAESSYNVKAPGMAALDARALAGLLLLGEDVVWSTARALAVREVLDRLRKLIETIPGAVEQVRRFRLANGAQQIEMVSGKRLVFASGFHGARGLSNDLRIVEDVLADRGRDRMVLAHCSGAGRPNPQVVSTVWSSA